ncbi:MULTISPECIES: hypothetical protein [unclassified Oceanobacillus]|uniref:hypothetical protein n=1 Tax=unclassified Oceanobacillus TaxID=2630292 RepID=UPI00300DE89D
MSKEVTNEHILQAITELSKETRDVKQEVNDLKQEVRDVKQEIKKNADKIDKLDAKVTVLSEGLLDTQAEVKILKNAK